MRPSVLDALPCILLWCRVGYPFFLGPHRRIDFGVPFPLCFHSCTHFIVLFVGLCLSLCPSFAWHHTVSWTPAGASCLKRSSRPTCVPMQYVVDCSFIDAAPTSHSCAAIILSRQHDYPSGPHAHFVPASASYWLITSNRLTIRHPMRILHTHHGNLNMHIP